MKHTNCAICAILEASHVKPASPKQKTNKKRQISRQKVEQIILQIPEAIFM